MSKIKHIYERLYNQYVIRIKRVKIGRNLTINGKIHIHGPRNSIWIGDDCVITSNPNINPTAGSGESFFSTGENGIIIIGNNVGMSIVSISAYNEIRIDDNVLLGAGVKIWDTDFHPLSYDDRIMGLPGKTASIHIYEGCFIGACSIILKGVRIGKHSIIGAGSVVTKDVPECEVWAGNPARFIKTVRE